MRTYYKRYLPHLTPPGGQFFITACLHGSLPLKKIRLLQEKQALSLQQLQEAQLEGTLSSQAYYENLIAQHKRYFQKYDNLLDAARQGKHYLKEASVAEILAKKFRQYDGIYYTLDCYTIMSNHFHLLINTSIQLQLEKIPQGVPISTDNYTPLSKIMQLIKGGSAFAINRHLGRKGTFWQDESFDHLVRDDFEVVRICQYILNNPVQIGLVKRWEDFPFSYLRSGIGFSL